MTQAHSLPHSHSLFNYMSSRGVYHKMYPCFSGQYYCHIAVCSIILPNGKDWDRIRKVSKGSRPHGLPKILMQGGRAKTNSNVLSKNISLTWEILTHSILGDNTDTSLLSTTLSSAFSRSQLEMLLTNNGWRTNTIYAVFTKKSETILKLILKSRQDQRKLPQRTQKSAQKSVKKNLKVTT